MIELWTWVRKGFHSAFQAGSLNPQHSVFITKVGHFLLHSRFLWLIFSLLVPKYKVKLCWICFISHCFQVLLAFLQDPLIQLLVFMGTQCFTFTSYEGVEGYRFPLVWKWLINLLNEAVCTVVKPSALWVRISAPLLTSYMPLTSRCPVFPIWLLQWLNEVIQCQVLCTAPRS